MKQFIGTLLFTMAVNAGRGPKETNWLIKSD